MSPSSLPGASEPSWWTQTFRDADRKVEEHEAETVAEAISLLGRAQVDRNQRADHQPFGRVAAGAEVRAERARRAGEEHVVDRSAERAADRLHLVERQRGRPGDTLRRAGGSLEARRRIALHQREPCDLDGELAAALGEERGLFGVLPQRGSLVDQRRADATRECRRAADGGEQRRQRIVATVALRPRREGHRLRTAG